MCWSCEHPYGTRAEYVDELRALIDMHGWAVQYVESDRRPIAYTIGLRDWGSPELLVTGQPTDRSMGLLNAVGRYSVSETVPEPGDHVEVPGYPRLEIVEVDQPDAHLKFAVDFYGRQFRALQLVWADDRGRWPWARGFNTGGLRQPVLGARAAGNIR